MEAATAGHRLGPLMAILFIREIDDARVAAVGNIVVVILKSSGVEGIAGWRYSVLVHSGILSLWAGSG